MQLPSFDNFLDTFDDSEFKRRKKAYFYGQPEVIQCPRPDFVPPDYHETINLAISKGREYAVLESLIYLEMYHEWLSSYLSGSQNPEDQES